jgi:RNA polymerase sigma factor (TIGR02999 family)
MSADTFAASGDIGAPPEVRRTAEQLLPILYDDVRRVARRERRRVGAGETLQTTALIHEAYLRLHKSGGFNDQAHFLRSAALAMRHCLINYARDRVAEKRGGGAAVESLDEAVEGGGSAEQNLLELNEALGRLAALSPRLAQVVECRFFAGYGDNETAQALGLTDRTVRRDWIKARAWLRRELGGFGRDAELPPT